MKKTVLGIGLILFAGYVLFRDSLHLPSLDIPIWTLAIVAFFVVNAIQNLMRKDYIGTYVCSAIAFIFLERHYDWLTVGTGTLILAAVLAGIGFSMIFKPKRHSFVTINEKPIGDYVRDRVSESVGENADARFHSKSDTVFGNKTRYINGDFVDVAGDVVFSSTTVYFDNAIILGDKATYSGDAVFSSVKLYVPSNWRVEVVGDQVLSGINVPPSVVTPEKILVVTGDFVFSSLTVVYI